MKFNKAFQHAFLVCLYLARAGSAQAEDMAENLSLPLSEVKKTLKKLCTLKCTSYKRGPKNGYRLASNIMVVHIMQTHGVVNFLTKEEHFKYSTGEFENRALAKYASRLGMVLFKETTKTFETLNKEMGAIEKNQFKGLEDKLEN